MKTSTSALALFGLLFVGPAAVSAKCFSTGTRYGGDSQNRARDYALAQCQGGGAFTGRFAPGEIKVGCFQYSDSQYVKMSVQNLNDHEGFDLNDSDCAHMLWDEISCGKGGQSDHSGWRARADPNNGRC